MAMQRDLLGLLYDTSRRWDGLVRLGRLGMTPAYLAIAPELVGQLLQKRWRDFVRDSVLLAAGSGGTLWLAWAVLCFVGA